MPKGLHVVRTHQALKHNVAVCGGVCVGVCIVLTLSITWVTLRFVHVHVKQHYTLYLSRVSV